MGAVKHLGNYINKNTDIRYVVSYSVNTFIDFWDYRLVIFKMLINMLIFIIIDYTKPLKNGYADILLNLIKFTFI